jgi:hypothetical protein
LNTFSPKRRHRIGNKFFSSVHYLLSRFHVDVIVFILSSFNVLLIRASQLPVACILHSFFLFLVLFRDFPARSVVKFHTYVVDVASCFYLPWIYRRFPSSWIVFCCVFWLDLCFVYGTMSPSDILAPSSAVGRLHRLRMFALVCENLVYGLLVAPSICSAHVVCVVRRLGFALVVTLIPSV